MGVVRVVRMKVGVVRAMRTKVGVVRARGNEGAWSVTKDETSLDDGRGQTNKK